MLSDEEMSLLTADDNCSLLPTTDHLLIAEKKRVFVHDYIKSIAEAQFVNLQNTHLTDSKYYLVTMDKVDQ